MKRVFIGLSLIAVLGLSGAHQAKPRAIKLASVTETPTTLTTVLVTTTTVKPEIGTAVTIVKHASKAQLATSTTVDEVVLDNPQVNYRDESGYCTKTGKGEADVAGKVEDPSCTDGSPTTGTPFHFRNALGACMQTGQAEARQYSLVADPTCPEK